MSQFEEERRKILEELLHERAKLDEVIRLMQGLINGSPRGPGRPPGSKNKKKRVVSEEDQA